MADDAVFPLLVIVPVRSAQESDVLFLQKLGAGRLIDPTLADAERQSERGDVTLCLTTDDPRVVDHVGRRTAPWQIKLRDRDEIEHGYFASLKSAQAWAGARRGGAFGAVLILEPSHPFRPRGLIANAIEMMRRDPKLDSVVSVVREYGNLWTTDDRGQLHRVTTPMGRNFFREVAGLCLLTRPATVAGADAMGKNVGFMVVEEQWALIDIHGAEGVAMARRFHELLTKGD
jgi:hypothetical protein